ncbi:hypothetical protein M9Y10_011901 [Tritrichomonas musculus]|uniref:Structure-specific endonuclease subunit SLX4 n=1 Tax=Tritrichomonas musculus TaxID=1915356 RepID=A0ABR2IB92_9EUKA
MSDFGEISDDEPPIFYERRTQEICDPIEKKNIQSISDSDSEITIISNNEVGITKESQASINNSLSDEFHNNLNHDHTSGADDSESDSDIQICSSPINHDFPSLLENLSSSQPSSLSLEPIKKQGNSQPTILSVGSESDSDESENNDLPELNFDHVRRGHNSQNSQELFNFSFPFAKDRDNQNIAQEQNNSNNQSENYQYMTAATPEKEQLFRKRISVARRAYVEEVLKAIKELHAPIPNDVDVSRPPSHEVMSDEELRQELAKFGFRFKTREDAISKLSRCWLAVREKETRYSDEIPISNANMISRDEQNNYSNLNPIDFIRLHSKFYEQILIYQPIPLASLYREMTEAKIKISVSRLRSILDDEGVAFSDDTNAIYPTK